MRLTVTRGKGGPEQRLADGKMQDVTKFYHAGLSGRVVSQLGRATRLDRSVLCTTRKGSRAVEELSLQFTSF